MRRGALATATTTAPAGNAAQSLSVSFITAAHVALETDGLPSGEKCLELAGNGVNWQQAAASEL
jgi:hypothetical protein